MERTLIKVLKAPIGAKVSFYNGADWIILKVVDGLLVLAAKQCDAGAHALSTYQYLFSPRTCAGGTRGRHECRGDPLPGRRLAVVAQQAPGGNRGNHCEL